MHKLIIIFASVTLAMTSFAQGRGGSHGGHRGSGHPSFAGRGGHSYSSNGHAGLGLVYSPWGHGLGYYDYYGRYGARLYPFAGNRYYPHVSAAPLPPLHAPAPLGGFGTRIHVAPSHVPTRAFAADGRWRRFGKH